MNATGSHRGDRRAPCRIQQYAFAANPAKPTRVLEDDEVFETAFRSGLSIRTPEMFRHGAATAPSDATRLRGLTRRFAIRLAGAVPTFPARLHVIFARESDEAVIIRRGPSKTTCVMGWNRRHDTFKMGQWMRGRVYERRCDLSPDGRHLIYFAMNGRWKSETRGAWTAISRAPYVKALALFPKGDCWHGGGLFTGKNRYWLNDGYGHATLRDDARIVRDRTYGPPDYYGGECLTVYYNRLVRDGWAMRAGLEETAGAHVVFQKALGGELILRKYCFAETGAPPGKGCYYDRHEIVRGDGATLAAEADWEWADRDGDRLVWAEHGILYAARIASGRLQHPQVLHDFNPMTFQAIAAPY